MREIYRHFAALLSYPQGDMGDAARTCLALLSEHNRPAADELKGFCDFVVSQAPSRIEEVYTATFDLQPVCYPYVGYQLFGESKQRALFLVKLQECYRAHGYIKGGELPDHLSEILQFLAMAPDATDCEDLVNDGLLPALANIVQGVEGEHPYGDLLRALQATVAPIARCREKEAKP
jgi:nitrate reductase molybdenum cofactor assembly chaperone NarJ/NarW